MRRYGILLLFVLILLNVNLAFSQKEFSGVYPHLAFYNQESECGIGAVVPWADRLWAITYAPHKPLGSTDLLYEITPQLRTIIRPESIGGTPANRMIHRETNQLIIGPYVISENRDVRVIPYEEMPGRPTGNARHLTDPETMIYFASMEEGLYEVNLEDLSVNEIFADGNTGSDKPNYVGDLLPGYHGKGVYSGQGLLIYANNGERGSAALADPMTPSGALASWQPGDDEFTLILREQFTEVTGPGGIYGNDDPEHDPIWSLGWDHKSVLLALLDEGEWTYYRLPKASHSYDGAHGWNTEWPRIREIGQGDELLATMHGTFWNFPKTFSREDTAGIRPRSNYLKVIGDFCRWNDRLVFGCDDTPLSEFVNQRPQKNSKGTAGQSNSNLWFVAPEQIEQLGPAIGRGSIWNQEDVASGTVSEPYLFAGYPQRVLHVNHSSDYPVEITIEVDEAGDNQWENLISLEIPANGSLSHLFDDDASGEWIRLTLNGDAENLTTSLIYAGHEYRNNQSAEKFDGLATGDQDKRFDGVLWPTGNDRRSLAVAVPTDEGHVLYELTQDATLRKVDSDELLERTLQSEQFEDVVEELPNAWLWIEKDQRYLFPKNPTPAGEHRSPVARVVREIVTERDMLHLDGTFYELPSENAGGVPFVRPISTHHFAIDDFCSYAGLLVMTGLESNGNSLKNDHIVRSEDGNAAVWAGVIDDLWDFGKPRGMGGPWKETEVLADVPSDPYLMTGYDQKYVVLIHQSDNDVNLTLEIDIDGSGNWIAYDTFEIAAGETVVHEFPEGMSAYWVRVVSDVDTNATVMFAYE